MEDPAQRRNIRKVGWDQSQMTDASMLIVLCGDMAARSSRTREIWHEADPLVRDFMVNAVDSYYRNKPETQRDEIMRSAGIFAQTLMLLAKLKVMTVVRWMVSILMLSLNSLIYRKIIKFV